jgi:tRNA 2-thiouridine synthesizing protein D
MTTFAILVQSETYASATLVDCQRFIKAAIALGHHIDHVFLYGNAVMSAMPEPDLPSDEADEAAKLAETCLQLQIPLLYCATAAEKRGILQPRTGFTLAGLAEFGMRLDNTDKLIKF